MGIYQRTMGLLRHNIKPVWVFDGQPSPLKYNEVFDNIIYLFWVIIFIVVKKKTHQIISAVK